MIATRGFRVLPWRFFLLVGGIAIASPVFAQKGATLDRYDRRFIEAMGEDSQTGVALAQLGMNRAQDSGVLELARDLARDWTALDVEVNGLAEKTNQALETDLVGDRVYRRLADDTDPKFDARFVDLVVERCRREIAALRDAAESAADPNVRQFAAHHRDTLQRDLTLAEQLRARLRRRS